MLSQINKGFIDLVHHGHSWFDQILIHCPGKMHLKCDPTSSSPSIENLSNFSSVSYFPFSILSIEYTLDFLVLSSFLHPWSPTVIDCFQQQVNITHHLRIEWTSLPRWDWERTRLRMPSSRCFQQLRSLSEGCIMAFNIDERIRTRVIISHMIIGALIAAKTPVTAEIWLIATLKTVLSILVIWLSTCVVVTVIVWTEQIRELPQPEKHL